MKEKDVEKALVRAVEKAGGLCWKFTSPGTDGVPDRLVLLPGGRMSFAEVKAPGKEPRALQKIRHEELKKLGFRVYVIDDPLQIQKILTETNGGAV